MTRVVRRSVCLVVRHHHGLYYCYCCYCFLSLFAGAHSLRELYDRARQTRILQGHAAAQLYANLLLLQKNPPNNDTNNSPQLVDLTTATRLAAASGKLLQCWQNACCCCWHGDDTTRRALQRVAQQQQQQLRAWFVDSGYTTEGVGQRVLKIPLEQDAARAPIYVTPAAPGTVNQNNYPFSWCVEPGSSLTPTTKALQCLVALFLLGLAVPVTVVQDASSPLMLQILFDLGLVGRCEHDPSLLVAVVSVVPVDLTTTKTTSCV